VKRLIAVIVALFAATSARADIGPFLPATKNVSAIHRIETDVSFPDHVLLITRWRFDYTREAVYTSLAPGQPITLSPGYHEDPELLIVPKAAAEPFKTANELSVAIREGRVPGVVQRRFDFRETVPSWADSEITVTYRVQRNGAGEIEIVRLTGNPLLWWYAAMAFITLAIAFGGWRLVRRMRRSPPAAVLNLPPAKRDCR
jgi:hypothetical protein